jgi:hypothetical protein
MLIEELNFIPFEMNFIWRIFISCEILEIGCFHEARRLRNKMPYSCRRAIIWGIWTKSKWRVKRN